jgi:transglutaminase-like putative cysteine protease
MKQSIKFLIVLLLISNTIQAHNYSFKAIPNWVKLIDIPDTSDLSKYDISSGFYLKLVDYQVNLETDAYFNREVRNVISYSGITNASQLLISYDTSYQHLQIHHLFIWRKGKKIDRTNDLSIEIMNNEYNLQQGIYTGNITAYANLDDIRKDDLIDFAYTLVGNNPIFGDDKYLFIPLAAMNPIDLYRVRVLYPLEKEYRYECVDCGSIRIIEQEIDDYHQIEIILENLTALKLEDELPSWITPFKYFTLGTYKSWKEVNEWAQSVFDLKNEPNLDEVFEEVFTGEETTEQKINKLINYVQDDIRYMGIQSGIGSIKPFSPEQVVKQRFGDCKDKSLLLVWLLKNIGIEKAYPALVNTILQHKVDKHFPSNQLFDHCIVTFEYNNDTFWIDPAIALQGGDFKDLFTDNYGKALVIGQPADSLQIMNLKGKEDKTIYIDEYTFKSFTEPGRLLITSKRNGFEADNRRLLMEYYSISDISDGLSDLLKSQFPVVIKKDEVKIDDDMEANTFITTFSYEVDGLWLDGDSEKNQAAKGLWLFRFEPQTLYSYLSTSICKEREFDYALTYPQNISYRIVFNFPKDILAFDYFQTTENNAFYFQEKIEQLNSRKLQIEYIFTTKQNFIRAADYKKICEQKNEIVKKLPLIIYFPK